MDDLLEVEEEIAETSLNREKERWQMEERWEELRLRKEREAEGEMRELILSEQDKLVEVHTGPNQTTRLRSSLRWRRSASLSEIF